MNGMPAWGTGAPSGESASWHLVHVIRLLPDPSEPELEEMAALNPASPDEFRQRQIDKQFLEGNAEPPATTAPPPSPHKH